MDVVCGRVFQGASAHVDGFDQKGRVAAVLRPSVQLVAEVAQLARIIGCQFHRAPGGVDGLGEVGGVAGVLSPGVQRRAEL